MREREVMAPLVDDGYRIHTRANVLHCAPHKEKDVANGRKSIAAVERCEMPGGRVEREGRYSEHFVLRTFSGTISILYSDYVGRLLWAFANPVDDILPRFRYFGVHFPNVTQRTAELHNAQRLCTQQTCVVAVLLSVCLRVCVLARLCVCLCFCMFLYRLPPNLRDQFSLNSRTNVFMVL